LRGRFRSIAALRGGGRFLLCLFAVLVIVGVLDYRLQLPGLVRALALTGLLTGLGLIAWRYLVLPFSESVDDLALALRIEERYPLLNDSLASTVAFLDRNDPPEGESSTMRREAIRRTLGRINGIDFNRVVDSAGTKTAVGGAAVSLFIAVLFAVLWPTLAFTACARLAIPFAEIDWPRKTQIVMGDVPKKIGRNKEYRLKGTLKGMIPGEVTIEVAHEGFPVQRKPVGVAADNTFIMHLKPEEVQKSFRFRIVAGDGYTPEYPVEVLTLPMLTEIDKRPTPQVTLDFPRYTELATPVNLSPGNGNLDIIAGTTVTLLAAADRPLKKARLEFQPVMAEAVAAVRLATLGSDSILGVATSVIAAQKMFDRVEAVIDSRDPRRMMFRFRPTVNGNYLLIFQDENELENSRIYDLQLRMDPSPSVRLEKPIPSGDALKVTATASIPLSVIVEDNPFAIRDVWVEYRTQPEESPRRISLMSQPQSTLPATGYWAGLTSKATQQRNWKFARLEFERTLWVKNFTHQDGSALRENDVITLQACADDFDDVSVNKEPGRSPTVTIRIVGREVLESELNQEQARIQKELQILRDKQKDAANRVKDIENRIRKGGKILPEREATKAEEDARKAEAEAADEEMKANNAKTPEEQKAALENAKKLKEKAAEMEERAKELRQQAQQLAEAEQLQQQIRERVGNEKDGLRAELERLQQTLEQNGLQNSNPMERAKMVARELERLAERELDQIEPKLNTARKFAEMAEGKTPEERKAEAEQRAKTLEAEAKKAEALAEKLAEREKQLRAGAESGDASQKAEAEKVAKQLTEQRQKAEEARAEAERERKEAGETPDPARARKALSEARRSQEEVERSLDSLLQRLEPWSSTLDVSNEANRIAKEQKELMAELETKKDLTGKKREELPEEAKAELDNLRDKQQRLEERAKNLLEQMKNQAEALAKTDPETSKALKKTAEQAEANGLNAKMAEARKDIENNKLNEAKPKQQEALAQLEKVQESLKADREERLERMERKLREAEKLAEEIMDEQEALQRKIREADKIKDPEKRNEELQRLAKEQQRLAQKSREVAKKLSAMGQKRGQQAMEEAAKQQEEAVKRLERGKAEDEKQEEILDRLDEGRLETQKSRKQAEEELGREQLVRVGDVLGRLRDRQQGHIDEAKRIQDEVLKRSAWTRGLRASMGKLGENQTGLADETASVAKKDLNAAPVFARLVERVARSMAAAGKRAAEVPTLPVKAETLPDAELLREQGRAIRMLDQLLSAVKEMQEDPKPLSRGGGGGGDEGGDGGDGGGGPMGDDSLPPPAQLRLLRAMQKEVNDRTVGFREKHPDLEKLDPKAKAELQEIRREQQEVADLLERLVRPAEEGGEMPEAKEPEKKEPEKKEPEKKEGEKR
jgi:hypothetical protein